MATIIAETESGERFEWQCRAADLEAEVAEATAAGLVVVDVQG